MKKSRILFNTAILGFFSLTTLSQNAMAAPEEHPFYLELGVGASINSDKQQSTEDDTLPSVKAKHKTAAITSFALGYAYSPSIRLAWNFSYLPKWRTTVNKTSSSYSTYYHADLSSMATTINGYYDFTNLTDKFIPYVMAGVGISRNEVSDIEEYALSELSTKFYSNSKFNFTWRLGAGLNYKINERTFISIGYDLASLGRVSTNVSASEETVGAVETLVLGNDKIKFKRIYANQFIISLGVYF
jgi:opacity protein-like surface antigen